MKNLKSISLGSIGHTVWCWLITLCSTVLYCLGSLIFTLAFGLTLFVLAALYMGSRLVEVSRRLQNGTVSVRKELRY